MHYYSMATKDSSRLLASIVSDLLTGVVEPDVMNSSSWIVYNCHFLITQPRNDLDFSQVLWTQHRWNRFMREYCSEESLDAWIDKCITHEGISQYAEIGYRFSQVKSSKNHQLLGSCLQGMSFHQRPTPQLTLTSRVSNLFPVAYLDLSLANLLAETLTALDPSNMRTMIQWNVTQLKLDFQWFYAYYVNVWSRSHSSKDIVPEAQKMLKRSREEFRASQQGERYTRKRKDRLYRKLGLQPDPHFYPSLKGFISE